MTNAPESESVELSEDQRAVADYLASEPCRQLKASKTWNWSESRFDHGLFSVEPGLGSLIGGLCGLALITLLFAVAFPIEVELLNAFDIGRPKFVMMSLITQTMLLPALVCFSCAAVTPMFWYGSIVLRFAMAIVAVLPGCIGFFVGVAYTEGGAPDDFLHGFAIVMFTCLMAIAIVALTVQMWSRWTLSHNRSDFAALPRTGIGSMIELTVIAAVGFAVFVSNDFGDYVEGMGLCGGVALMAAIAIISTQIAFLRDGPRNRPAAITGLVFAFGAAAVVNGFFAVMEFGWDVLSAEAILVGAASIYGALLIGGLMWLCLRWLQFCGWRCIDQRFERERAKASGFDEGEGEIPGRIANQR